MTRLRRDNEEYELKMNREIDTMMEASRVRENESRQAALDLSNIVCDRVGAPRVEWLTSASGRGPADLRSRS